jgi:hypothetical protein
VKKQIGESIDGTKFFIREKTQATLKIYSKNPARAGEKVSIHFFVKEIVQDRIETVFVQMARDAAFSSHTPEIVSLLEDELNKFKNSVEKAIREVKK